MTVAFCAFAATSGTSSPVTLTMVGSTPHSKAAVLASSGATTLSAQAKVVTPSQAGMVVTQLAPGISLRPGEPIGRVKKVFVKLLSFEIETVQL